MSYPQNWRARQVSPMKMSSKPARKLLWKQVLTMTKTAEAPRPAQSHIYSHPSSCLRSRPRPNHKSWKNVAQSTNLGTKIIIHVFFNLHYETIDPTTLELLRSLQKLTGLENTRLVWGIVRALQFGHRRWWSWFHSPVWRFVHSAWSQKREKRHEQRPSTVHREVQTDAQLHHWNRRNTDRNISEKFSHRNDVGDRRDHPIKTEKLFLIPLFTFGRRFTL